jgi:hypothetical protein
MTGPPALTKIFAAVTCREAATMLYDMAEELQNVNKYERDAMIYSLTGFCGLMAK